MIARALTANSTTAVRTINNGLCIGDLDYCETPRPRRLNYRGPNEPAVNARLVLKGTFLAKELGVTASTKG
jgi:hypothetical protein